MRACRGEWRRLAAPCSSCWRRAWRPASCRGSSPVGSRTDPWPPLRVAGALLVAAGAAVVLHAFARFVVEGIGTPAPVAPPERLVVGGVYRHVRNPMYVAVLAAILGQALLLGQVVLVGYAAAAVARLRRVRALLRGARSHPALRRRLRRLSPRRARLAPAPAALAAERLLVSSVLSPSGLLAALRERKARISGFTPETRVGQGPGLRRGLAISGACASTTWSARVRAP